MTPTHLFAYMVAFAGGLLVIGAALGLMHTVRIFFKGIFKRITTK